MMKKFQRALARWGMFISYRAYKYIPYCVVKFFSNAIIALAYVFVKRHKRIARESLWTAFEGQKNAQEIQAITRRCFWSFGYAMVEMIYSLSNPQTVKDKIIFSGKEHLDAALGRGKGVVAVTAHFGNFPLMMMALGQQGYPVSSVIRPVRDPKLESFLVQRRKECQLETVYAVPRRECVNQSLKVLRSNGILFVPLDQNFGNGKGVFVDFFGRKAATATGPVIFAERTGATILPMFIIRQDMDRHRVVIEEPFTLQRGRDEQETIYINISRITQMIERYIREYPHEWGWFHRRWKSKPKDGQA